MDTLVERAVGILEQEPIDIYVNPTFLPDVLAKDYDTLWTEPRRKKVIAALVRNGVAMEINNRYRLPSASFMQMAKASGVKFTFGTNNARPTTCGGASTACRWSRSASWAGRISSCQVKGQKRSSEKGRS